VFGKLGVTLLPSASGWRTIKVTHLIRRQADQLADALSGSSTPAINIINIIDIT
jgi:hypothetical protein